jgi:hypothetical protein
MKRFLAVFALAAAPAQALAQEASEAQQTRIDEVLAGMQCEFDPANVEVADGTFDLDDVMCADGQYDIKLDANFAVTEQRKE